MTMKADDQYRFRGALRLAVRLCALLGFLLLVVTLTPLDLWWARMLAGESYDGAGEVLVVLGGSEYDDGFLGMSSYLRCLYAVRCYRAGTFEQVITCGGAKTGKPVAIAMRDFLISQGIPSEAVSAETTSLSTHENAQNVKQMLDSLPGRKVLLTSDYHMFRSRRAFAKTGLRMLPMPIPDVQKRAGSFAGRWSAFEDLVLETIKIAYYYLRGWV